MPNYKVVDADVLDYGLTLIADEVRLWAPRYTKDAKLDFPWGIAGQVAYAYLEGKEDGRNAGEITERERFWKAYQVNGNRTGYNYAFNGAWWNDDIYNPLFPIIITSNNAANSTYQNATITDTKVPITIGTRPNMFFYNCENLRIVCEFNVLDGVEIPTNTFSTALNLEEITFSGVISYNLNLSYNSKLTHDSLLSAINCLKDYSADTSGTTYKLTLGSTNLAKLTDEEQELVRTKGWDIS